MGIMVRDLDAGELMGMRRAHQTIGPLHSTGLGRCVMALSVRARTLPALLNIWRRAGWKSPLGLLIFRP